MLKQCLYLLSLHCANIAINVFWAAVCLEEFLVMLPTQEVLQMEVVAQALSLCLLSWVKTEDRIYLLGDKKPKSFGNSLDIYKTNLYFKRCGYMKGDIEAVALQCCHSAWGVCSGLGGRKVAVLFCSLFSLNLQHGLLIVAYKSITAETE